MPQVRSDKHAVLLVYRTPSERPSSSAQRRVQMRPGQWTDRRQGGIEGCITL